MHLGIERECLSVVPYLLLEYTLKPSDDDLEAL